MIRAIAFDLDDTLFPEVEFVYSGYRAIADEVERQLGLTIYDDLVAQFASGVRGDVMTPALQKYHPDVKESYVQQLVQVYRGHQPEISPFPEVRHVLDMLKGKFRLALVSDGYLEVQKRKLQALNLDIYFDAVVFSGQWGRDYWKPHTRPFEECARLLALDPSEILYVGDNPRKDFHGARRLGMHTIRVRHPDGLYQELEPPTGDHAPEMEIESLIGLEVAISQLAQAPSATSESNPC